MEHDSFRNLIKCLCRTLMSLSVMLDILYPCGLSPSKKKKKCSRISTVREVFFFLLKEISFYYHKKIADTAFLITDLPRVRKLHANVNFIFLIRLPDITSIFKQLCRKCCITSICQYTNLSTTKS